MATKKKVQLDQTVDAMLSDDWKERKYAEYHQLKYRIDRLERAIKSALSLGETEIGNAPIQLHMLQLDYMRGYLNVLAALAKIEKVKL